MHESMERWREDDQSILQRIPQSFEHALRDLLNRVETGEKQICSL